MIRRELPADEWPNFMEQFSRLHHGKLADVMTAYPAAGAERYARKAPLLGVVDERHGSSDEAIELILGGADIGARSHSMRRPARVWLTEWNDAYSAELEIESADGARMVVRVGPAEEVLPPGMMMDGILLE